MTSYSVADRRSEIGIRRALGASDPTAAGEVIGSVGRVTAAGVVLGIVGTLLGGRVISSLLVGVDPSDPVVLVAAATILSVVAALATLVPVARAVRIAPTEVLKGD